MVAKQSRAPRRCGRPRARRGLLGSPDLGARVGRFRQRRPCGLVHPVPRDHWPSPVRVASATAAGVARYRGQLQTGTLDAFGQEDAAAFALDPSAARELGLEVGSTATITPQGGTAIEARLEATIEIPMANEEERGLVAVLPLAVLARATLTDARGLWLWFDDSVDANAAVQTLQQHLDGAGRYQVLSAAQLNAGALKRLPAQCQTPSSRTR
jgi:hypothetical protein